jgi:hypothetical protein
LIIKDKLWGKHFKTDKNFVTTEVQRRAVRLRQSLFFESVCLRRDAGVGFQRHNATFLTFL